MNKYIIIIDIDGTIANKHPDRDYREYDKVHLDSPIHQTIIVINLLIKEGYKPIFITGRKDDCKKETTDWLNDHLGSFDYDNILYMRKSKDHRKDFVVKKELLNKFLNDFNIPKENIFAVFDDRPSVIDMWIEEGLFVFNMNNGRGDF